MLLVVVVIPAFPSVVKCSSDSRVVCWFSHLITNYLALFLGAVFLGKVLSSLTSSRNMLPMGEWSFLQNEGISINQGMEASWPPITALT